MRLATIDIGTNTVLLLIVDSGAHKTLTPVTERATITRLGEGVDRSRKLSPKAVARTRACLEEYSRLVEAFAAEQIGIVGTSAMRDAEGGEELRAYVRSIFGVDVRIVSGEEEARLAFRGALSGLRVDSSKETTLFDIGGGSTEIVMGRIVEGAPAISFVRSFDVGSVRLTERHFKHDPPAGDEVQALERTLKETLVGIPLPADPVSPIGVAGTMTTLASVSLALVPYDGARVHGHVMKTEEIRRLVARLSAMSVESRRKLDGMEPKRADVIVAGGLIALALLERMAADSVVVSDRGVRWGFAAELSHV